MSKVEIFGIAGPAGAGRSTAASMILSLLEPGALVEAGELSNCREWVDVFSGDDQPIRAIVIDGIESDELAQLVKDSGGRVVHITKPGHPRRVITESLIDARFHNDRCKADLWRRINLTVRGWCRVS